MRFFLNGRIFKIDTRINWKVYKIEKDLEIMDQMKRLTAVKQKIEKRLKGRP